LRSSRKNWPNIFSDNPCFTIDWGCNYERKKCFIFLEKSPAYIFIYILCYLVYKVLKPLLQFLWFFSILHWYIYDFFNILERILVHRINNWKIFDDEKKNSSSCWYGTILLSNQVNTFLQFFAFFNFNFDIVRCLLRLFKCVN
jgi:hypothetical protein